jgi:hypothetical protein
MLTEPLYFPAGCFGDPELHDAFVAWFSKHLRAAHELPMCKAGRDEALVYRFLWLRTFHHPLCIRISMGRKGKRLSATRLTGMGGYEPGEVDTVRERPLSDTEWSLAEQVLSPPSFWQPGGPVTGVDGAQWILERQQGSEYAIGMRWAPKEDGEPGAFRKACLFLVKMAGSDLVEGQVY